MQEITNTLTDMHEMHMIPDQSNQIQGGWQPKLQEHITSEDPPAQITRSTKSPGSKRPTGEKMIGEFRALSVEANDGWVREAEMTPEDEARADRVMARLARQFPGIVKSPKLD
jgi:hypothetical protein